MQDTDTGKVLYIVGAVTLFSTGHWIGGCVLIGCLILTNWNA